MNQEREGHFLAQGGPFEFGEGKAKYSTAQFPQYSQGECSTVTQSRGIYGPISPVQMFAELKAEADRLSNLTPEQMNGCVGAGHYDMRSFFAGHVEALRQVVSRYQTSLPQVDITREVEKQLQEKILGRPLYDQTFGRVLSVIETTLALLGVTLTREQESAIRRQVQNMVNTVQTAMRAEWDSQWWELIKPQVEAIPMMATLEVGESWIKDRTEVYTAVHDVVYEHLYTKQHSRALIPTTGEEFSKVLALAVVEGLQRCGLVEEQPTTDTAPVGHSVTFDPSQLTEALKIKNG